MTGSPAPGSRRQAASAHPHPVCPLPPGAPGTGSHARTVPVPSLPSTYATPPFAGHQYSQYAHGQPPYSQHPHQAMSRTQMPTGVYPYATPHSQYPGQPMPVPSSSRIRTDAVTPERPATARYECSYCQKGFTRPSSLKVRTSEPPVFFNTYHFRSI